MTLESPNILFVAGEASADRHGASLLRELKRQQPDLRCFGVGGSELEAEGMEIVVPAKSLNVVGIADWRDRWREVLGAFRTIRNEAARRRPDIAVLMDLPDFNLKLSRKLKALGVPVVYYISPQVWAWRSYRVRQIRRYIDKMLVVFPFEKAFYQERGVNVDFVGHPVLEQVYRRERYRPQVEIGQAPRLAILPGSRPSELRYHAQTVRNTVRAFLSKYPGAEVRIPVAPTLTRAELEEQIQLTGEEVRYCEGPSADTVAWADLALVASGTATLETSIIGTPFVLFYQVSRSSALLLKYFIQYRGFFGIPNLLHGREVVREFLQEQASPEALMGELTRLVDEPRYRTDMVNALLDCRDLLGRPGASHRAAVQVLKTLKNRNDEPALRSLQLSPAYT